MDAELSHFLQKGLWVKLLILPRGKHRAGEALRTLEVRGAF